MAIGDIQNRFAVGGQEYNRTPQANANGVQNRPPQETGNGIPENRLASARDLVPENNRIAGGNTGRAAATPENRIQNRDVVELGGNRPEGTVVETENRRIGGTAARNIIPGPEENALLERTGNNAAQVVQPRPNPEEAGVQRTNEAQVERIQNANAGEANTAPAIRNTQQTLTQENQVGSRLDITG